MAGKTVAAKRVDKKSVVRQAPKKLISKKTVAVKKIVAKASPKQVESKKPREVSQSAQNKVVMRVKVQTAEGLKRKKEKESK